MPLRTPSSLGKGGRALWREVARDHPDLDATQQVQLLEACRAKDRLDKLDLVLRGDADTWMSLAVDINSDGSTYELRITQALTQANATANGMKQLLAALRLPDELTGQRPQRRGGGRGAYRAGAAPSGAGTASVKDRLKAV